MRGRRSKPAAVKEASGNPGRRKIAKDPGATAVNAGTWVPEMQPDARAIWDRTAPQLREMKLLSSVDHEPFARWCGWMARWKYANGQLENSQMVIVTESERVTMERLNRWLQIMAIAEVRMIQIEDRFGLNPSFRQQIMMRRAGAQAPQGELPLDGQSPVSSGGSPLGLLSPAAGNA